MIEPGMIFKFTDINTGGTIYFNIDKQEAEINLELEIINQKPVYVYDIIKFELNKIYLNLLDEDERFIGRVELKKESGPQKVIIEIKDLDDSRVIEKENGLLEVLPIKIDDIKNWNVNPTIHVIG